MCSEARDEKDNQDLTRFWNEAFLLSDDDRNGILEEGRDGWKDSAPSGKLYLAAASLGSKKKVLDYGCGSGWAGIIAAMNGCPDVTAADTSENALEAVRFTAAFYGADRSLKTAQAGPGWLASQPCGSYDGLICSNVLDVVPPETAKEILRESARIVTEDADVVIGLNYYLSPEAASAKGLSLTEDGRLYLNGVLRLVSRTDEEWIALFDPFFTVVSLDYFSWPGEKAETRRLFRLKKKSGV